MMGNKSRKLLPPIVRPNSLAPAKKFPNELSGLFGKNSEDAKPTRL